MKLTGNGLIRINYRHSIPGSNRRLRCNFNCSYCILRNIPQYAFSREEQRQTAGVWDALSCIEDRIIVRVNFDGESFFDPLALECCLKINRIPNVIRSEFVTNNSIDPRNYMDRLDMSKCSFNCSFHPESISREKFLEHILILKDAGCPVVATMVVAPGKVKSLSSLIEFFAQHDVLLKPLLMLGPYQGYIPAYLNNIQSIIRRVLGKGIVYPQAYSRQELKIIRKHYYSELEFKYQYGRSPEGKLCWAGVDMINVFPDGSVLRCFNGRIGSIFDLIKGTSQLQREPYSCYADSCQCPSHMIFLDGFRKTFPLDNDFADHYFTRQGVGEIKPQGKVEVNDYYEL